MTPRLPRGVRAILAAAGWIVPARRRPDWRRQWEAEAAWALRSGRSVRFAWGAIAHAIYLRREEGTMRGYLGELVHAARGLARRPGFTLLSAATLAVGIGAAVTVFSVVEALLLRPLPLGEADRLVSVHSANPALGMDRFNVSYPDFVDWTGREDLFASASMYTLLERDLAGEGDPERLRLAAVHVGFFETLGVSASRGRLFGDGDQEPAADRTVVLSHRLWVRRFGSDPDLVGATIRLDAVPHTVIGVTAPGQAWPLAAEAWIPLRYGSAPPEWVDRRSNHAWQVVARLQPGVDVETASEQVRAMAAAWYSANESGTEGTTEAGVISLRASIAPEATPVLATVMGAAVLFVLLIACINQSNLLVIRAWSRGRELSLRAALGAGQGRMAALLLGESAILALAGGALGLLGAASALRLLRRAQPEAFPPGLEVEVNATVVAAAIGISLLASLLAGLAPTLRTVRGGLAEALKDGGTWSGQGRSGARLRRGLVVVEIALSMVLLTAAGLTIRAFQRQLGADPGFSPENVLTFTVRLPSARYGDEGLADTWFDQATERLAALPGVRAATTTSRLPLGASRNNLMRVFVPEGGLEPPAGPDFAASWVEVDPAWFETLGVEPTRGRAFGRDDGQDGPPVIVVNETFARQLSPDQEIVGRRIRSWRDENLLREVVGVVPDLQFDGVARGGDPIVFVPRAQASRLAVAFMVRTEADPLDLVPAVRATVRELDPDVALDDVRTLEEGHRADLAAIRMITALFATFGTLALVLAVSGVYGLVATSVAQRTREIGVRMAMGGSRGTVRGRVLAEGGRLALVGLAAGMILSLGAARILSFALFGMGWLDPVTFLGVGALLAGAALAASWVPASRATRVDPVEALRSE